MKVLVLMLCLIAGVSCAQRKDESTIQRVRKFSSAMSKPFKLELNKLIEINNSDASKPTVIVVVIDTVQSECVLSLAPSLYYFKEKLKGYLKHKNYLVVFYNDQSFCYNSIVNFEEMYHDQPHGYPTEDSTLVTSITYDPWGRKYWILES